MGNVCSFDSPDLVRTVAAAAAGGAVAVMPTFAAALGNLGFLSVTGSFTGTNVAAGQGAQPTVCSFPTQVDVTPVVIGPNGASTACDVVRVVSPTFTGPVSCPSVLLNDLDIGSYRLGFNTIGNIGNDARAISVVTNTFSWTTPLTASTTTLEQATITITTSVDATTTTTATVPPADATTTITVTTATGTSTVIVPAQQKSTVFTATTTVTDTRAVTKTLPQSTVTKYSCPTSPAYCPKGSAPKDLTKCPAADNTCYKGSNGHVYQLECGTDRPGKDLTMKKCTTMDVCIATCSKTYGCNAVAYYPADKRCYLKSSVGRAVKDSRVIGAILVSNKSKYRRGTTSMNLGSNPDFTYPPTPVASTETPGPTSTTETITRGTITSTQTETGDTPAFTSTVYRYVEATTTVTSTSTSIVSAKKTVFVTITSTRTSTPSAKTVKKESCTARKGYRS